MGLEIQSAHKCGRFSPTDRRMDGKLRLEAADDVGEDVADGRAKQRQDDDYDDSDENENERVFDEALAFFTWQIQHGIFL